jgi:muramoyltetrapeptide carboxypeptidase LdcA involved in peptidoglycan recycling
MERINGILFGRPGGQVPIEEFKDYDSAILDAVGEYGLKDLPIVTHMDFGHTDPMTVLPLGVECEIDCILKKVSIMENAVTE